MKPIIFISFFLNGLASFGQTDTAKSKPIIRDNVFTAVDQMPEFPGGENAMMTFISSNLVYPEAAIANGKQGRIFVKFTVMPTGEVMDIHVISKDKIGFGLEEAAVAVIRKMPNWKPGKQNGIAVPVYFNIPIRFRLF